MLDSEASIEIARRSIEMLEVFGVVETSHGPWQARMRRRREHQYNHYQQEEENLQKMKQVVWDVLNYQ